MKYLKLSLLLLFCSIITNEIFVFADDTFPLSGTVTVTSSNWDSTGNRSKINANYQKIKKTISTCDNWYFTDKPYNTNGTTVTATTHVNIGVTTTLDSRAIYTGTWYAKIKRGDFSLINQTAGYTYDPNALVL